MYSKKKSCKFCRSRHYKHQFFKICKSRTCAGFTTGLCSSEIVSTLKTQSSLYLICPHCSKYIPKIFVQSIDNKEIQRCLAFLEQREEIIANSISKYIFEKKIGIKSPKIQYKEYKREKKIEFHTAQNFEVIEEIKKKKKKMELDGTSKAVTGKECNHCFDDKIPVFKTPCKHYICVKGIMQALRITKDGNIPCSECKKVLKKEFLYELGNIDIIMRLDDMANAEDDTFIECKLCNTTNKMDEEELENFQGSNVQCGFCEKDICRFCGSKWNGKINECKNEVCITHVNELKCLDIDPEMQNFSFNGVGVKSIFRCRLCPWCGIVNFRVEDPSCKHIKKCSGCGKSYCHVCLRKKTYGVPEDEAWGECGEAWDYCKLAPKQTSVPGDKKKRGIMKKKGGKVKKVKKMKKVKKVEKRNDLVLSESSTDEDDDDGFFGSTLGKKQLNKVGPMLKRL